MSAYVYILECFDGTYYTGWTNDLDRRIKAHSSGKGAKYTRGRRPVRLVHQERCKNESVARRREAEVKSWTREMKKALIEGESAK
jgi:putative endonuclease